MYNVNIKFLQYQLISVWHKKLFLYLDISDSRKSEICQGLYPFNSNLIECIRRMVLAYCMRLNSRIYLSRPPNMGLETPRSWRRAGRPPSRGASSIDWFSTNPFGLSLEHKHKHKHFLVVCWKKGRKRKIETKNLGGLVGVNIYVVYQTVRSSQLRKLNPGAWTQTTFLFTIECLIDRKVFGTSTYRKRQIGFVPLRLDNNIFAWITYAQIYPRCMNLNSAWLNDKNISL